MRRRKNDFWWIFLLVIFLGSSSLFPLIVILGVVLAIAYLAVKQNEKKEQQDYRSTRATNRTVSYRAKNMLTASEIARINVYLRQHFRDHEAFQIDEYTFALSGSRYTNFDSLDVFENRQLIGTFGELASRRSEFYESMLMELLQMASSGAAPKADVIDVVATPHKQPTPTPKPKPAPAPKEPENRADSFIDKINGLNNTLVDEDISNQLYTTTALLTHIKGLELNFPDSSSKLDKLYEYYLPILVDILTQFNRLQNVKTDPNYEQSREKLTRTIALINNAMNSIIASMSDQDFINLAADMSTLEAVLQKDGFSKEATMQMPGETKE